MTKENLVTASTIAASPRFSPAGETQVKSWCDDLDAANTAKGLRPFASATEAIPSPHQAKVTKTTAIACHAQLTGKKARTDTLNLYSRHKNQRAWKPVSRDTKSPDDSYPAPSGSGTHRIRERCSGVD